MGAYFGDGRARKAKKIYRGAGTAVKVKKGYEGKSGVAERVYSSSPVAYTGTMTEQEIEDGGKRYRLYTLTDSGMLSVNEDARIWMCGCGHNGNSGDISEKANNKIRGGLGGNGAMFFSGELPKGEYQVILSADPYSSVTVTGGTISYDSRKGTRGSGGGGTISYSNGTINGVSSDNSVGNFPTYPFGITALGAHCAGGAGGCVRISQDVYQGGKGGTLGAYGGSGRRTPYEYPFAFASPVEGGVKGGGKSCISYEATHCAATFYGGAGGGGNASYVDGSYSRTFGGSGYQGVVYLLVAA